MRGRSSFSSVFDQGHGVRRGEIVAKYTARRPEPESGEPARNIQVGFVVRRGTGSAVRRNRIRRMLRESYRLARGEFEKALPQSIELRLVLLWVGRPEAAVNPDFGAIRSDLGAALHKIIRKLQADGTTDDREHAAR